MEHLSLKKVVEEETKAIEEMELGSNTEATFICPNCGGTAHVKKHLQYGYTSYCDNGCFSSRQ